MGFIFPEFQILPGYLSILKGKTPNVCMDINGDDFEL